MSDPMPSATGRLFAAGLGSNPSADTPTSRLEAAVRAELLERLQFFPLKPRVILDLGCRAGSAAEQLRRRFPRAQVLAMDAAYGWVREARRRQRFWRRFECVCAHAQALPLAAHSVDLVFSNLMLPWCEDLLAVFSQVQSALRPGGLLLYSSLGPDTLPELRAAWEHSGAAPGLHPLADMAQLGAAMSHSGLTEPVMDREMRVNHYPSARTLLRELRASRAPSAAAARDGSGASRAKFRAMLASYEALRTEAGLPARWEVIYGAGFASAAAPHTPPSGEFAVPVGAVRPRGRP